MFTGNWQADTEVMLKLISRDYSGQRVAFSRYADGEEAILSRGEYLAKKDGWGYPGGDSIFARRLQRSIECTLNGWCVGISSAGYQRQAHTSLWYKSKCSPSNTTYAEIFAFSNFTKFAHVKAADYVTVGPRNADHLVPLDSVQGFDESWFNRLMLDLLDATKTILVSAGPLANIICHEYWRATGGMEQSIFDVGSLLDTQLKGEQTRRYHSVNSPKRDWSPSEWH